MRMQTCSGRTQTAGAAATGTTNPANKHFWKFRNAADKPGMAELLLYGDIAQYSWYKDDVTAKQFADELAAIGPVNEIRVRINSGGGDVFAAQAIGNLLEQNAASVTAQIDGLCASAATIVACHCDRVVAANDSIYMIHPAKMGICDYMGTDDLRQCMDALTAIREVITDLYAKKTCRPKDEVATQMDNTSWWTSSQAKANGFHIFFFGDDFLIQVHAPSPSSPAAACVPGLRSLMARMR